VDCLVGISLVLIVFDGAGQGGDAVGVDADLHVFVLRLIQLGVHRCGYVRLVGCKRKLGKKQGATEKSRDKEKRVAMVHISCHLEILRHQDLWVSGVGPLTNEPTTAARLPVWLDTDGVRLVAQEG
jgi:hypothetical protein